jgi:hypothetical protein
VKKLIVILVLFMGALGACTHTGEHKHAYLVRDGMLRVGIHQKAFLDVWGQPDRTGVTQTPEQMSAKWGFGGPRFFKGSKTVENWTYEKIGVVLLFDGAKLIAWKTDKTTQELKASAKPAPEAQ